MAIRPLDVANLSADVYNVFGSILNDFYEISGVTEYLRGSSPDIRRTATEATIIEGASNVKTAHKLAVVEEAARQIGIRMLAIAKDVFPLTDVEETRLVIHGVDAQELAALAPAELLEGNDPTQVQQLSLTPGEDMWRGRYEVFVEQGSTELRNPVLREQKWRDMIQIIVPAAATLQQFGVSINIRKLFEMWFEAAGIDDINGMFADGVDPLQAMLQQAGPEAIAGLLGDQGFGALRQLPGAPNPRGAQPPNALITSENSGQLQPVS